MVSLDRTTSEIFSAYAFAEDDDGAADLQKGTHLRIYAGLGASFPLTPFVVARFKSSENERFHIHVTDRDGHPVPRRPRCPWRRRYHADAEGHRHDADRAHRPRRNSAAIEGARLLDQKGRTIAMRDRAPWWLAAPLLHKLRIRGSSGEVGVPSPARAGERPLRARNPCSFGIGTAR